MSARADLEIRGGGVVAVDTDTLRAAAGRFDAVRIELDEACRRAASVRASLGAETSVYDADWYEDELGWA